MKQRLRDIAFALVTLVVWFDGSSEARAQESDPAVVPYRPSVATPADLPAPGWPELEAGVSWAKGGDTPRSFASPLIFKLAWDPSWGILIGTDAYKWQRTDDDSSAHSGGDTTVTLKYKLPVDEHLALGAQFGASLPTARTPLGTNGTDWEITTIVSIDDTAVHFDVNLGATHLGAPDPGTRPWQGSWAVAGSHPLDDRFGVTGEVSGIVQRGTLPTAQYLAALSYNVSRALVLDVAVAAGLSRASPDWQLITGMTVRLGRWF